MNGPDDFPAEDDPFVRWLLACEEEQRAGKTDDGSVRSAPDSRYERGRAALRLLRGTLGRKPAPAEQPLTRLGRFAIRRELGRGAYGVVFLAYDPRLRREVALKVPRPNALLTPTCRQRFLREARAAAALDHPNLVAVYDAGEDGAVCYLASVYCPGVTLADWLKGQTEPVPFAEAARFIRTLADAVRHAHERGVVHRDLKPANILLVNGGGVGGEASPPDAATATPPLTAHRSPLTTYQTKITDFGLAKQLDPGASQTQSGAIVGTPQYIAPEQARGKNRDVGPAADVYALGAILYELLTGRPPFRGETTLETLALVSSSEPVPPRRLRPRTPVDLQTICLKCLEKESPRRYAGAAALAEDLSLFLENRPILARPRGAVSRACQWARRQPVVAGLALVVVVAAAALLAGGLHYHLGLREAQRQTDAQKRLAQQNLRKALAAIDQLLTRVGDKTLAPVPRAEAVRKELLQDALRFYEDLLGDQTDDPDLMLETALAYRRLGQVLDGLMMSDRAGQAFQESVTRLRGLAAQFRDEPVYRFELGVSLKRRAEVDDVLDRTANAEQGYREAVGLLTPLADEFRDPRYRLELARTLGFVARVLDKVQRFEEGERSLRRALTFARELVAEDPENPAYRREFAAACNRLGNHLRQWGDKQEALRLGEEAAKAMVELLVRDPTNPEVRYELGGFAMNLGNAWLKINRPARAREFFERAQEHFRKLAADFPATPQYQFYLAGVCGNIGHTFRETGCFRDAERAYRERLTIHQQLAAAFPQVAGYHAQVAYGHYDLARLCREEKKTAEARPWLEGAITHGRHALEMAPTNESYRVTLREYVEVYASTLLDLGDHAGAAQLAAEVPRLRPEEPDPYVLAAGLLARAAAVAANDARVPAAERQRTTKAYSGQALALLTQALDRGYTDRERLRADSALAALRNRNEFRALLTRMAEQGPKATQQSSGEHTK